jgi:preprotein translocase subunit SecY
MLQSFFKQLKNIFSDRGIVFKILFVLVMFIVLRFLSAIPLPGVNAATLSQFLSNNQLFSFLSIFSGGGLSIMSIMSLGVGPYITASIIMQVLAYVVPSIKEMYHDGGEIGRAQVNQYSRYLSVLFSVLQGFGILALLRSQGVFTDTSLFSLIQNVIILTAGSFLTLWIADLISEFGIGNGTSMIIFAGIVASIPGHISQAMFTYDPSQIIWYVLVIAIIIVVVWITVAINEAERRVQITYTRQSQPGGYVTGGADTYLPLKLTLAGVIPLIFASSLLTLPQIFAQIASLTKSSVMTSIGNVLTQFQNNHLLYGIAYFVLVFLFTYFYAATVFDADSKAEQIQKAGGFIPGVRPGAATADFIGNILSRITFFGAIFLAAIAILPLILQNATGNTVFAIGGTSVLIAVSVVIDLIKKLSAQATMREY